MKGSLVGGMSVMPGATIPAGYSAVAPAALESMLSLPAGSLALGGASGGTAATSPGFKEIASGAYKGARLGAAAGSLLNRGVSPDVGKVGIPRQRNLDAEAQRRKRSELRRSRRLRRVFGGALLTPIPSENVRRRSLIPAPSRGKRAPARNRFGE